MRIVFMGTAEFAAEALRAIAKTSHELSLVVSQPDRPAGRGRKESSPPVKLTALSLGYEVFQPEKINTRAARARIREARPDVCVVAAFGQILRPLLLSLPSQGCLNIHGSILPRHRGASPINAQILSGDDEVGVSIMKMDEGMDTGPVGLTGRLPALPEETAGELHDRLAALGAELIVEALQRLEAGTLTFLPQDAAQASHAGLMQKSDGQLDFSQDVSAVDRRVRGLQPWPGAQADIVLAEGERRPVRLGRVQILDPERVVANPGQVLAATREGIDVACAAGILRIKGLQPIGKRMMTAAEFLNGYPLSTEDYLASPNRA